MKFQIKNRRTGAVQYECELSAELAGMEYSFQLGFAVKKAVSERANLARAYLAGVNLEGANLARANLARANLARANLARANLEGANLSRANLADANLADANLENANLADAYLARAYLARAKMRDGLVLSGKSQLFQIGPIGSRNDVVRSYTTNKGVYIQAGCFWGTIEEFTQKLEETHGNNEHGVEYRAALAMIDVHTKTWPAE